MGQDKVRAGAREQSFAEGCTEDLGALLLGCEKWEHFMYRRWKCGRRHYLPFVFSSVVLTSNLKCTCHGLFSTYTASMHKHFISGGLLSPQLCRHQAHKCHQPPTSLQLNPPTVRRITCKSSSSNEYLQSDP